MKIEAKIEWVIDDATLSIKSGTTETVLIDSDCVESDELDIKNWIENELAEKYGVTFIASFSNADNGDFVIKNMTDLIEDLKFDEFEEKTDPGYAETI